jgi:hypothetical protein
LIISDNLLPDSLLEPHELLLNNHRLTLARPTRRWEDNIKMDLQEVACFGIERIELAQDKYRWQALVNAVMNFQVP